MGLSYENYDQKLFRSKNISVNGLEKITWEEEVYKRNGKSGKGLI